MSDAEKLTETEMVILGHLVSAWNAFSRMEMTHPCHKQQFADGIHACQQVIGMCQLQRVDPETWPTYRERGGGV